MNNKISRNIPVLLILGFSFLISSCSTSSSELAKRDGVECHSIEISGSRIRERLCATPEQWAEYEEGGEDGAEFKRRLETISGTLNTQRLDTGVTKGGV